MTTGILVIWSLSRSICHVQMCSAGVQVPV